MGETIVDAYRQAKRRLLLIDYDGTLIEFAATPEAVRPTPNLIKLLKDLAAQPGNTVVIISGRDQQTLERTFSDIPVSLAAEHGCFLKDANGTWLTICDTDQSWKPAIRQTMHAHALTLPGAFVEEKAVSLVWHYRQAASTVARKMARRLTTHLRSQLHDKQLRVLPGHKIIEVCSADTNKGQAATHWLQQGSWDFVLAAGDDTTDEDLFAALPPTAFTVKVGRGHSTARIHVSNPMALRALLREL